MPAAATFFFAKEGAHPRISSEHAPHLWSIHAEKFSILPIINVRLRVHIFAKKISVFRCYSLTQILLLCITCDWYTCSICGVSVCKTSHANGISRWMSMLNVFDCFWIYLNRLALAACDPPRQNAVYQFWWLFFRLVCDNLACEMYTPIFVVISGILYIINNLIRCWRHTNSYALTHSHPSPLAPNRTLCLHRSRVLRDIVGMTVIMIIAIIVRYFVIAIRK